MILVPNPQGVQRLEDRLADAHRKVDAQMATEVAAKQSVVTGELAGSYQSAVNGDHGGVFSNSLYAGAIEHGAWVEGRGPHISSRRANHALRDIVKTFPKRMTDALRHGT